MAEPIEMVSVQFVMLNRVGSENMYYIGM